MMIGATSWQIRGTYLENVEHIKDQLEFCELLVYTWNKTTSDLLQKEIEKILELTNISVHLPTDNLENAKIAFDFFKDFECINMTLHPFVNFKKLADFYFTTMEDNKGASISIENLENDLFFDFVDYLKDESDNLLITMDYGHLLFEKRSISEFYKRFCDGIKEIHFHGADEKKAHIYPTKQEIADFKTFITKHPLLQNIPVCIELFKWGETSKLVRELKSSD